MPLLVTLLPLVGLSWLADEWVEWALVSSSAVIGTLSLCLGFRHHGQVKALAILSAGLALLCSARISEHHHNPWHALFAVLGGLTVAGAHFLNAYLCRTCGRCQHSEHGA